MGIDVVGEGEEIFGISIVVLKGDLHFDSVLLALDVDGFRMDTILILIEVFDEGENPSFIKEVVPLFGTFILNADGEPFV